MPKPQPIHPGWGFGFGNSLPGRGRLTFDDGVDVRVVAITIITAAAPTTPRFVFLWSRTVLFRGSDRLHVQRVVLRRCLRNQDAGPHASGKVGPDPALASPSIRPLMVAI
jgi:hypothetical protein